MNFAHTIRRLLVRNALTTIVVTSAAIAGGSHLLAQTNANTESLILPRGTFFEILADHSLPQAQQSWVLTQDQTFLEAGRQAVYRTRFTEVGNFALRLDLKSTTTEERATRILAIEIAAKNAPVETQPQNDRKLVQTNPAIDDHGRTIPAASQSVIALIPLPGVSGLSLDMNNLMDTDADGNPENDNDTQGTYFSLRSTPLYLWLEKPVTEKTLTVSGTAADGSLSSQTIHIVDQRTASEEDEEERLAHGIATAERSGGIVALSYTPTRGTGKPLLFHWNFGDGQESLLDAPTHTYAKNDTYTVHVQVRDLTTGTDVEEATTSVSVTTAEVQPSPTPAEEEEQPATEGKPLSSFIVLGIKILLAGLFSILLGVIAIFLLAKFRTHAPSLQKTLAKAEEKLVGEKGNDVQSETLEILDAEPVEEPVKEPPKEMRRPRKEPPPPAPKESPIATEPGTPAEEEPEPSSDDDDVPLPDWLKPEKGTPPKAKEKAPIATVTPLVTNPPKQAPLSTTMPPWLAATQDAAPIVPEPPSPAPQQEEPPTPPSASLPVEEAATVPPWLQPESQEPPLPPEPELKSPPESPTPEGAGEAPVAPPAPVPPWLQSATLQEPATAPAEEVLQPTTIESQPLPVRQAGEPEPLNEDEPVAFISADSIAGGQGNEDETPPPPSEDTSAPPPRTQPKV